MQAISEIDLLLERHGKEGVIMYGRSPEEKSEFLRGAVGLFNSFKKKALCTLWGYVNALVYFEVGYGFKNIYLDCFYGLADFIYL